MKLLVLITQMQVLEKNIQEKILQIHICLCVGVCVCIDVYLAMEVHREKETE